MLKLKYFYPKQYNTHKQNGSVLFISLIILVLLTLLGLSSLRSTQTQEKMANNYKELNRSFQSAELAMRAAENWILTYFQTNGSPPPALTSSPGNTAVWVLNSPATVANKPKWWTQRNESWWSTKSVQFSGTLSGLKNASNPRYIIEQHSFVPDSLKFGETSGKYYYRITAKGTSTKKDTAGNYTSRVLLQSTYTPN